MEMGTRLDAEDIFEVKKAFQETANKWQMVISVCWQGGHEVYTPQKQESSQLALEGMEMPTPTEFINLGE